MPNRKKELKMISLLSPPVKGIPRLEVWVRWEQEEKQFQNPVSAF